MTTAEDQDEDVMDEEDELSDPRFSFESKPAPSDFTPDRKTPGRVRQPSYFDDILRDEKVFNSNRWQMVPVTGKEHSEATLRELNRAKLHLNKQGLEEGLPEIGLDLDVREDAVYYKSRTAQKRERKNGNGSSPDTDVDTDSAEETEEYESEDAE